MTDGGWVVAGVAFILILVGLGVSMCRDNKDQKKFEAEMRRIHQEPIDERKQD